MAGSFTDYLEEAWMKHLFSGTAYTQETNLYLGLSYADPGEDGTGIVEPVGGGYARMNITVGGTYWDAAGTSVAREIQNKLIEWPAAATGDWVGPSAETSLTHWGIYNAASGTSGGLFYGTLTNPQTILEDDTPRVDAGDATIDVGVGDSEPLCLSDFAVEEMLDHSLRIGAYAQPDNWVALCDADPVSTDTDLTAKEPAGVGSYARVNFTDWVVSSDPPYYKATNNSAITFLVATADWGTMIAVAVCDASTTGNMLAYAYNDVDKQIDVDDIAEFADSSLFFRLD